MLKLADNPPMRPSYVETIGDLPGTWWVARTKSRFEKAFAWDLLDRGIPYFLPMVENIAIYHGRRRKVMAPLFPGYVFIAGDSAMRIEALATQRVYQVFPVSDRHKFLSELTNLE